MEITDGNSVPMVGSVLVEFMAEEPGGPIPSSLGRILLLPKLKREINATNRCHW